MDTKFFKCSTCGNLITFLKTSGLKVICCGKPMSELLPERTEMIAEKHMPKVCVEGNKVCVKVGEKPHPMEKEHFIEWVMIDTKRGMQFKTLKPGDKPEVSFKLCDGDEITAAFAYCNIHELWKTEVTGGCDGKDEKHNKADMCNTWDDCNA